MPFPSCNIFAFQFKTSHWKITHILKKALCCCLQLTQSVQEKMQLFIPGLRFNVIEACHCIYMGCAFSVSTGLWVLLCRRNENKGKDKSAVILPSFSSKYAVWWWGSLNNKKNRSKRKQQYFIILAMITSHCSNDKFLGFSNEPLHRQVMLWLIMI